MDDIYYSFQDDRIKLLKEYFYGSWVVPLNNLLFYYLPNKLSINLQEWAQVVGVIFQTSVLMLLFWYFSKCFCGFDVRKKLTLTSIAIMAFFFFMYLVKNIDFVIYSGFFRFIIPSLLFFIWGYYYHKYLNGEKIPFLWLISVVAASSSEVVGFIMVVTSFAMFAYFEEEKSKNLLSVFVFSFIGLAILLCSFCFQRHLYLKSGIHTISEFSVNIIPFLKVYLIKFLLKQGLFWLSIFGLIYLNRKYIKTCRVEIALSLALVGSIMLFVLSLVLLGKTHYSGGYWIIHRDLYTIFYTVFLFIFIILSLNLIKNDGTEIFKKSFRILAVLFIPLFILSCIHLKSSISTMKYFYLLRDKMVLYYLSKDEDIILPRALCPEFEFTVISHIKTDKKRFLNYYPLHRFFKDLPAEDNTEKFVKLLLNYYKQVYHYKSHKQNYYADFIDGNTAMDYYFDHGGKLPDKEKFSDLEIKP